MKLDILVLAAHPDDAELGCGGTIAKEVSLGRKVGIVDFTRGELGTRGSVPIRDQEAADAARILGLSVRESLNFKDGFFQNDETHQREVIRVIRRYQPQIVIANSLADRHPDHPRASGLAYDSCFYSGLAKIETIDGDKKQQPWRPNRVYHFIQSQQLIPDFIVDVSDYWETKMKAIRAFKSQFHDPTSNEPETFISSPAFIKLLEARGHEWGHTIGVAYGEGFLVRRVLGVDSLSQLL